MSTHTFATLEIPAAAWDAILVAIKQAGPEYLERYLHDEKTIHFAGSEVGLVRMAEALPVRGLPREPFRRFDANGNYQP
jgi:hypothetical protein